MRKVKQDNTTVGVKGGEKGSFRLFAQWRSKQAL